MVLIRKSSNSSIGSVGVSSSTRNSSSPFGIVERSSALMNPKNEHQKQNPWWLPCEDLYEFAKYIPLRLNERERSLLQVLESALNVSEYTDNVDVAQRRSNKTRRILDGILEECNISTGLAVCGMTEDILPPVVTKEKRRRKLRMVSKRNEKKKCESEEYGSGSLAERDPRENAAFFQELFEVGRRNKVLNPSKMRDSYGKLMHLLQDAQSPTVARSLGFSLHKDLLMVRPFLETVDADLAKKFLRDPRVFNATVYIFDRCDITGQKLPRERIHSQVLSKNKIRDELINSYAECGISSDDFIRCLDSISDAFSVIHQNIRPVRRMLHLLENNFNPARPENHYSLQLSPSYSFPRYSFSSSSEGAKLSHSHSTQYTFVSQTLRLWCEVHKNMHRLWVCADEDLLSTSTGYHLWNTGQGLNRVQSCPKVSKIMRSLLSQTQQAAGTPWVGLSVIHLGDRDVPNALVFIDKYTQIPRFLHPIVDFIDSLSDICRSNTGIESYVKKHFGSEKDLIMTVLTDFFKHGFDGSGDDGGSCIDGRLTSAWNWTSRIVKKKYYHIFMLSGFQGFDGEFK